MIGHHFSSDSGSVSRIGQLDVSSQSVVILEALAVVRRARRRSVPPMILEAGVSDDVISLALL
jgi:hypothetical protein